MDLNFSHFHVGTSYVVNDTYVVTAATHADRSVMSGHTNPI